MERAAPPPARTAAAADATKPAGDAAGLPERAAAAPNPEDWPAIVAALELQGAPRQLAANCALIGREGSTVRLALDPRRSTLRTNALEDKLAQALSRYFGGTVRLEIELHEGAAETPARALERAEALNGKHRPVRPLRSRPDGPGN